MRLWSIHPEYLDAKGLVALWREALLAQNVLQCNTKGYKKHPLISLGSTSYQDFLPYWPDRTGKGVNLSLSSRN
jgi:hypothetical protein